MRHQAVQNHAGSSFQHHPLLQGGAASSRTLAPGILTMQGTLDAQGTPVLMVTYLNDSLVRLYELPTFASRGVLTPVRRKANEKEGEGL